MVARNIQSKREIGPLDRERHLIENMQAEGTMRLHSTVRVCQAQEKQGGEEHTHGCQAVLDDILEI